MGGSSFSAERRNGRPPVGPPRCEKSGPAFCRTCSGLTLVELAIVVAVAAIVVAIGLPPLLRTSSRLRLESGAAEIASALRLTRAYAIRHGVKVALRFGRSPRGEVTFTMYRDGDGDGVRGVDIESGVDPQEQPTRTLTALGRGVRFGFPPGPLPPAPGDRRPLERDDPIRFNRSDLASFSPSGTSTPGTVYLTDGARELVAVRVTSRAGRIRVMRYDRSRRAWRRI